MHAQVYLVSAAAALIFTVGCGNQGSSSTSAAVPNTTVVATVGTGGGGTVPTRLPAPEISPSSSPQATAATPPAGTPTPAAP